YSLSSSSIPNLPDNPSGRCRSFARSEFRFVDGPTEYLHRRQDLDGHPATPHTDKALWAFVLSVRLVLLEAADKVGKCPNCRRGLAHAGVCSMMRQIHWTPLISRTPTRPLCWASCAARVKALRQASRR